MDKVSYALGIGIGRQLASMGAESLNIDDFAQAVKDAIAGKLASDLSCDELIILTTVPYVYKNFGKEDQAALETLTVAEAKDLIAAGQFEEGTMLPKIEAAISYLEKVPAGKVLITSMDHVKDAIKGKAGTVITA